MPEMSDSTVLAVTADPMQALRKPGSTSTRSRHLLAAFFAKRSALTVRNYRTDLVHFGRWWKWRAFRERGAKFSSVQLSENADSETKDAFVAGILLEFFQLEGVEALGQVLEYVNDLHSGVLGTQYAGQTINHRIAALRAVTELAQVFGMCSFDLRLVDSLDTTRTRSTEGCGPEGYAKLLAQIEIDLAAAQTPGARFCPARNGVIITLLHDAGLRRFEPLKVRWPENVDLEQGRLRFRGKKRSDPEWFEVLNEQTVSAIRRYLEIRGDLHGYLLFGRSVDKPLHVSTVNRVVAEIAQRAQVKVTPHGLRHTAATTLLNEGGTIREVASFLRHKTTAEVQTYDDDRQKLPKKMGKLLGDLRKTKVAR